MSNKKRFLNKIIMTKKISFFSFLAAALILVSGCSISFNTQKTDTTAGVFKSTDKAATWAQANTFVFSGGIASIAGVNVVNLQFDPEDNKALYLNSSNSGLFYSYDAAAGWQKAADLSSGRVESVAVDPKNKCVIYAAVSNTIKKSVDCNRSFDEIYVDTRAEKTIRSLAVDGYNNLAIYAGNNTGDILKSLDGGVTWQVIERINKSIKKILVNPKDTRIVYVATDSGGIYRSSDSGNGWKNLNDSLKDYQGALNLRDLFFDPTQKDALVLVSKYGILKSNDGASSWTAYQLITPANSVDIYAAVLNPVNNQELYYATASTFYKTADGGQNWITSRLPTGAVPSILIIDPKNPNVVYMGFTAPSR
ncbi:MAG: hypothetical protein JW816_01215 [Candidatus Buchananbacteria bacterium]|nr:hypothetical protein [Candidatus Buchananbacteria bacterium]